jgi:16S rRNA (cytidine1402-2'-O)-methyltransferase
MGTLYIVSTPLGNLDDISSRAIETLKKVSLIACEDTRRTIKLLNHFGIRNPLVSYHDFNEERKTEELVNRLSAGDDIALVSDAGTPAISDPGYRLVRACRQLGVPVTPIPGPNAAITALSASGLPSDQFLFAGFLPPKKTARIARLVELQNAPYTLVFYESPHRIEAMLADMHEVFGDREACVAREITKIHEEYLFGQLQNVRQRIKPLGEFVVVVEGAKQFKPAAPTTRAEVLKTLGMTRDELYDLFFKK